jgi:hypothetical protein
MDVNFFEKNWVEVHGCMFVCSFVFESKSQLNLGKFAWKYDLGFTSPNARSTSGKIVRLQGLDNFRLLSTCRLACSLTHKGSCKT